MRRLSRLCAIIVSFWTLAFAHSVLAQDGMGERAQTIVSSELPLTQLNIIRSSRTDVPGTVTVETAEIPENLPRILDEKGAERLIRNEGITLQWIGWEERGPAWVAVADTGHWLLMAGQGDAQGGTLDLEGFITEIGSDHFIFEGTIKVLGTPDEERLCNATKQWRFAVTQGRSYYRLREFEWCDGLTDYIDIYFPPSLR
ncbi:MAG: hypothetical protein ABJ205_11655 [Erythrobacter sp.]|uniref:hypothetical protein n=1 Tax=Erythrobacter sp. TaxID=1042 RepID=UPI003263E0BB